MVGGSVVTVGPRPLGGSVVRVGAGGVGFLGGPRAGPPPPGAGRGSGLGGLVLWRDPSRSLVLGLRDGIGAGLWRACARPTSSGSGGGFGRSSSAGRPNTSSPHPIAAATSLATFIQRIRVRLPI